MQQQIILAVIQFFLQMVCPCAGRDRKMKSDYPARLLSLCQTELFTNLAENNPRPRLKGALKPSLPYFLSEQPSQFNGQNGPWPEMSYRKLFYFPSQNTIVSVKLQKDLNVHWQPQLKETKKKKESLRLSPGIKSH